MATVKYISPYPTITGVVEETIDAADVRALCRSIIAKHGVAMGFLLDEHGELSKKIVLLVNRRNAYTLDGTDTVIEDGTEIMIMPYLGWG